MEDADFWDPNTWPDPLPYRAVYLSDRDDTLYCIIDRADYEWASKRLWRLKKSSHRSRGRNGSTKVYVVCEPPYSQKKKGNRSAIFLHKEVLVRAKGPPPNDKATIGDHVSGDSLDNRRKNLQWATPKENRHNRNGLAYYGRLL